MRLLAAALALLAVPLAAAAPEQVHLGLPSEDASSVSVLFLDLDPRAGPQDVRFGSNNIGASVVDGPSLGRAYEAVLDGLAPDTAYEYGVGDRTFAFRTPPAALAADRPLRVVALGDMGISARAAETTRVIDDLAPDLILHLGDISYAEGRQNEWIDWFRMVEPVAATRPWVTALGNHETYTGASVWPLVAPPSAIEIAFYEQRFGLPGNEMWYSFDRAGVHFVALDTFSQESIAAEEVAWLEADLAAHADAAWTIVFLHEPPFSSNDHGSSERVQDAFVALFEEHGVDLVLAGHDHGYERSHPQNGVLYVVSGGGGESLYSTWEEPQPGWSAKRGADYHVTLLEIGPDSIDGRVVLTADGDLADTFTIARASGSGAAAAIATNDTPLPIAFAIASIAIAFALIRTRRG